MMSFLPLYKKEKIHFCVFSGFEGILNFEGKPASGAKLVREWYPSRDGGDVYQEETITDAEGKFNFKSIWKDYEISKLEAFRIVQVVKVCFRGGERTIFLSSKSRAEEFSEFRGEPSNFSCEITEEIRSVRFEIGFIGTSCYWDELKVLEHNLFSKE